MRVIGGREGEGVSHFLLLLTFILLELEMPMFPVKLLKLSLLLKCYKQAGALHMGQGRSLGTYREPGIFLSGEEGYEMFPSHV